VAQSPGVRRQRNYVLQRALELEMITKEQHDRTINETSS
jgi:membrane carboxypeptidase/penicillin-binding protein